MGTIPEQHNLFDQDTDTSFTDFPTSPPVNPESIRAGQEAPPPVDHGSGVEIDSASEGQNARTEIGSPKIDPDFKKIN